MLLGVDTGGTFTDFVLSDGGSLRVHKVLSTPDDPSRAIANGIEGLGLTGAVAAGHVTIVHGSTIATNAVLTHNGARTAYVANRGFTDVLRLGRQARTGLYSLTPAGPVDPVPEELLIGTGGRLAPDGRVIEPLTEADLEALRRQIVALKPDAVAINLLYSYVDDRNERRIEAAIGDLAFVCRSSEVLPQYKEYERGIATWLNAWLGPVVARYLTRLVSLVAPSPIVVMQSSGGTISAAAASRRAVNLLLSGPAGGLAAARHVGAEIGQSDLLTFDMGGTSTDVALIGTHPTLTDEASIGSFPVAVPMADIHTIGAGGGSIAFIDAAGALHVGPRSAGAHPGPACYGLGGVEPTVTDANVVLGRIPATLRLAGTLALHADRARAALETLAVPLRMSVEEAAEGVVAIANAHMAQALRVISLERGHDPRQFSLACFGGAGGLHVCALAEALDIPRIIVPAHAGVFSALGMLVADASRALIKTVDRGLAEMTDAHVSAEFEALADSGRRELIADGAPAADIAQHRSADLRYRGQSFTLTIDWTTRDDATRAFHEMHQTRYGHSLGLAIELVNIRCDLRCARPRLTLPRLPKRSPAQPRRLGPTARYADVVLFERAELCVGQQIEGPALIVETMATTFVDPLWRATVDTFGHLRVERSGTA
jgi:N-methylhydantoinase A